MDDQIINMAQDLPDSEVRYAEKQLIEYRKFYDGVWIEIEDIEQRKYMLK